MRLVFLPTLFDMRGMLGERLYVDFVWMWRENEHKTLSRERRANWAAKLSSRTTEDAAEPAAPPPELRVVQAADASSAADEAPAPSSTTAFPATREHPARVGGRRKTIAVRF